MTDVLIRNSRTGEEYVIAAGDIDKKDTYRDPKTGELTSYEEAGFKIVHVHEAGRMGEKYEQPKPARAAETKKAD